MSKVEDFLSKEEEQAIIDAICRAEKNTSGEIRVHIESKTTLNPMQRAIEVFNKLEMYQTAAANAVLIYVAVVDKKFAICGDKGINEVVPPDFWESTKNAMAEQFKQGYFKQGLIDGITMAGQQLRQYFPYQDNDKNELTNEISVGQ
ncbi:TPM domain-containing protein [Flavobacterium branchiophilum]|uniref:TPM domain-containing protein n=1 Tax=Flavobacterium branchiophilum (strain FL-15) TaxID=1034807 RepID=G2Z2F6_FLABF|nr:TPM domain-containing protein [Flavobacterium branchiophilum]CCB70121.1 Protein of unknown function [Flavobacterium branchiophilum FL-15]